MGAARMLRVRPFVTDAGTTTQSPSIPPKSMDSDAIKVVRKLRSAGHEAFLVGGCVRDLYLGLRPKDFDAATSATPEQVHRLFRNSRIIGRRFKIVHVFYGPKVIETSTFRTAPQQVNPEEGTELLITQDNEWGTVEDDALRRDFTINGLFCDVDSGEIVDFVNGLADLDARVIRTIGEPKVRFQEDPVRMIRACKFAARLDFDVEPACWSALLEVAPDIQKCSKARVLEELYKLLRSGSSRRCFELLHETDLLRHIWPAYVGSFPGDEGLKPCADVPVPVEDPSGLFWRYLESLDSYVKETGQVVSNGVLQAVLFAPLLAEGVIASQQSHLDRVIDQVMHGPCVELGVARRDRELARQIVMAKRQMSGESNRRRRRSALVQRQCFHDALVFLGISVEARGEDGAELAHWQRLALRHQHSKDAGRPGSGRSGAKKRRRRGRKRSGRRSSSSSSSASKSEA